MSPRAIAVSASAASDADGASHTTRSAGAPTAIVRYRCQAKGARVVAGGQRDDDSPAGDRRARRARRRSSMTPRGITPVPVGVSLATHTRGKAPASRARFTMWSAEREVAGLDDLQGHLRLGDDPVDPALVERRRAAVDVAAHVGSQLQEDLVVDRARAWDGRAAAVRHDAETVLLSQPHLGLAVPTAARSRRQTVLRVTDAVPRHLGEVVRP